MKINWRLVVGVVFSAAALALILKDVSISDLAGQLTKANYLWLIPTGAIMLVSMWARARRWRALLDDRISVSRSFHISNAGNLLNNVLPLRLGELGRAYLASRNSTVTTMQGLSTVLIERLLDVLFVFAMLIMVLPLAPSEGFFARAGLVTAAIALVGVVSLFVAAAFRERAVALARSFTGWLKPSLRDGLLSWGDDFLRGVSAAGGKRLAAAIGWSAVVWIGWGMTAYVTLLAFVPGSPWYVGIFVNCALALGLTIPSAPSGAGLYEAAAVASLAVFGVPGDVALAYAIVLHVFGFLVIAVFGTIGLDREGESFKHLTTAAQGLLATTHTPPTHAE